MTWPTYNAGSRYHNFAIKDTQQCVMTLILASIPLQIWLNLHQAHLQDIWVVKKIFFVPQFCGFNYSFAHINLIIKVNHLTKFEDQIKYSQCYKWLFANKLQKVTSLKIWFVHWLIILALSFGANGNAIREL